MKNRHKCKFVPRLLSIIVDSFSRIPFYIHFTVDSRPTSALAWLPLIEPAISNKVCSRLYVFMEEVGRLIGMYG